MLLVFVSSKCEACVRDAPLWTALSRQAAERGVTFAVISVDQNRDQVATYAKRLPLVEEGLREVPVWFSAVVGPRLQIRFVPSYWAIDSAGRVTMQSTGVTPSGTSIDTRAAHLMNATLRPSL
jgi:thiol-disulfide isomerase/thioredoxin